MTNPRDVKYANESIARWQEALKQRALLMTNNISFACLRGVLHGVRDRLDIASIARFGNHLPAVQRGVFYQDWVPAEPIVTPDLASFEMALSQRLLPHVHMPEGISADTFWVIKTESEPVDAVELRDTLPAALQRVWDQV